LFTLLLGAIGLTLAFALMLHFNTAPAIAFAYLLFFTTLRFIATFALTRERILHFVVAAVLCMAASFWALRSTALIAWDRHDASPYSIAWRSLVILLCLLAAPHYASHLASRAITPLRRAID
jgi:uncharacterized membrane protein YwzB